MVEFPTVTYEAPEYLNQLDDIFTKLLKYENDYSEELLEIRKQQIKKHSYGHSIADILNDLANLIGQAQTPHTDAIMEHSHKMLVELHAPVYFHVPFNHKPFHKWEQWTFGELLDKYTCLALSKGWEDYYTLPKDFSKNKRVTKWGLEDFDVDYESIKNYHIFDMLNDLVINDYIICGYDPRSFMNDDERNRLLKTFNKDSLIDVKLKEKYTPEELGI